MSWIEHLDYKYNEAGLLVLLENYLLDKGYCCGSGCLHCPYQYEQVPEPKRSHLLEQRKINGNKNKTNGNLPKDL